jgi:hypothetical protein
MRNWASCLTAALVVMAGAGGVFGQAFTTVPEGPAVSEPWSVPGPRPTAGTVSRVDMQALRAALAKAPPGRADARLGDYGLRLTLPAPTGALVECVVAESPVMEAALQAKFPSIRTYLVQSLDGRSSGRLEVAPRGVTGMLRGAPAGAGGAGGVGGVGGAGSVWMIDPWRSGDAGHAVSYWLRDLPGAPDWNCETTPGAHGFGAEAGKAPQGGTRELQQLRTLRLAMACTGEYGLHQCVIQGHDPNPDDPMAAIVTVAGRANVVYEADFAIHFNLVANNNLIVYFNPVSDPYPTTCDGGGGGDCSSPYLSANISNLGVVIGNANFDIGHLLTRVAGGVAYLSSVCGSAKAGGISGIPRGGDVDPMSALVVIHEMGHQFGANHTFSGTRGRCAGNVNRSTAWEAGSGSSPMAYAGGCPVGNEPPTDNVALFADPFFHHGSYNEVMSFLGSGQANCLVRTSSTNNIPRITSVTPNTVIPPGTPFVLSATATDSDGEALTYSWEQFDNGVSRPLSGPDAVDNGQGALFRIFPPVASPSRTFPQMADVLSGVPTPGEMLPTATGTVRRFRVIVRDNHPGAGGTVVSAFTELTIPSGSSAFGVTRPAAGDTLLPGKQLVQWTTGNTQNSPFSCAVVHMWLSGDGGATFPIDLGVYANNGNAIVPMPSVPGEARLRIEGEGRIFFAVSGPFTNRIECGADINHDGTVTSQDFFDFLTFFFENSLAADINDDGFVTSQDFFDFIVLFFAGC